MQDRYAFDVGDFAKLGLLRHLAPALGQLGVVWYATSIESEANDGRHTAYLQLERPHTPSARYGDYRPCDAQLFEAFRAAMADPASARLISRLEILPIWPAHTSFAAEPTTGGRERRAWFRRALTGVDDAAWVFCDPDNGMARPGSALERRRSPKHILFEEVREIYVRGQSLVVYHHLTRAKGGHLQEIAARAAALSAGTGCRYIRTVHFRRGSARAFFILAQPHATRSADEALTALQSGT